MPDNGSVTSNISVYQAGNITIAGDQPSTQSLGTGRLEIKGCNKEETAERTLHAWAAVHLSMTWQQ